jgi:hypothetical protein
MITLISDPQFQSIALVIAGAIAIIPATLAAVWSRSAKQNSSEASAHAAGALHEVKANGGMSDPDPTLKDYVKYVGEFVEKNDREIAEVRDLLEAHLKHSQVMDKALAEVYFAIKPTLKDLGKDDPGEEDFSS